MEAYRIEDGNLLVPVGIDETLNTVVQLLTNGTLVFFFGAGISLEYPALLPLAKESRLLPGLRETLYDMLLREISLEPEGKQEVRRLALEAILDFFSKTLGDKALARASLVQYRFRHVYSTRTLVTGSSLGSRV